MTARPSACTIFIPAYSISRLRSFLTCKTYLQPATVAVQYARRMQPRLETYWEVTRRQKTSSVWAIQPNTILSIMYPVEAPLTMVVLNPISPRRDAMYGRVGQAFGTIGPIQAPVCLHPPYQEDLHYYMNAIGNSWRRQSAECIDESDFVNGATDLWNKAPIIPMVLDG